MRLRVWSTGLALGLIFGLLEVVPASAQGIAVAPTSVAVGGTVTVSGGVGIHNGRPLCPSVTVSSEAFAGHGTIAAAVSAGGSYSVRVRVLPGVAPGTYAVFGACLPVASFETTLTVTPGLPATGDGSSQLAETGGVPTWFLFIVVIATAAAGLTALGVLARGRRSA